MKLFKTVKGLNLYLNKIRQRGQKIGFVPTMGALHEGHISLVTMAKANNCIVVVSIFINPSQFNNQEDLKKYPRMLELDSKLLKKNQCDVLFAPEVEEVYPPGLNTAVEINLEGKDLVMEGEFRPGHFKGMLEVVNRLLDIVKPHLLFMGQKDFQQQALVAHMIHRMKLPVKLIVGETLREPDGLAMSSRNMRLDANFRIKAGAIFRALKYVQQHSFQKSILECEKKAMEILIQNDLRPEYFKIVDGMNLRPLKNWDMGEYIVACTACWAGEVRLIDNLVLTKRLD